MAVLNLIVEYAKQNEQLRQVIEESNQQDIKSYDRRVAQLFDRILDEQPNNEAEIRGLTEFLVGYLASFSEDSPLNRRIRDKIISMVSSDAKNFMKNEKVGASSHGML